MKRLALRGAGVLLVLAVLGFLISASGVIPLKASSGHWKVTNWFLEFSKDRSVALHSRGVELAPLEEPWLVLKGAGHYETGCAVCHGSPGRAPSRLGAAMLPPAPELGALIAKRDPQALFYVVQHGIKFTAMPAWPAEGRDDEVRAVVAFLLEYPRLDEEGYRRLVWGETRAGVDEQAPFAIGASCARCHGSDGNGRGAAAFPRLAGQKPEALYRAMEAYARGERHSGMMQPIAQALRPDEWRELTNYFSGLPSRPEPSRVPAQVVERGREIANLGIPERGVPSCVDCHGPGTHRRNPAYPNLAGQHADYLVLQLELFRSQRRGGSAYAHLMHEVANRLTAEQLRDVAAFYASLILAGEETTLSPSPLGGEGRGEGGP